jgi:ParB/RepB/Spo0J family partition protein
MELKNIKISKIREDYYPRKNFSKLGGLKGSIEKEGLLDPILVRQDAKEYIVIDGVMRLRVVKELEWEKVDCIIEEADEERSYHLAYIKNTERSNLNPIEESLHLKTVQDKFGYNVEDLVRLGYAPHRSTIDDKLSLLTLPEDIQKRISVGTVMGPSIGYEIAKVKDEESQRELVDGIIAKRGMSVREVKQKIRSLNVRRKCKENKCQSQAKIPQGDIPGVFIKDSSDMSELANGSVGLIVTSPPYGVGMEYEEDISFENHLKMMTRVLSECVRKLFPGGKSCINVGDIHNFGTRNGGKPEIELVGHHLQRILRKHNVRLVDKITWKKCTPGKRDFNWSSNPHVNYHNGTKHTSYRILNNTEHIYIFQKEGEREVPYDIECESKISKDEWKEWVDGVWEIPPVKGKKGHS